MSESFDPYRVWLGIPPESRPPTHYQLLGISPDETEQAVIEAAVLRQSGYVRNFQIGKYAKDAARILNEIAAAKACLLDSAKRAKYDAEFKPRQPVATNAASPTPAPPVGLAIDLDQLATPVTTSPNVAAAGSRQRRSEPLPTFSGGRKSTSFPWKIPAVAAAALAVFGIVFIVVRPRGDQPQGQVTATDGGNPSAAIKADDSPTPVAAAGSSEPVTLDGSFVPAETKVPAPLDNASVPASPEVPSPKPTTGVDLLKLIYVERDRISGDWRMENGKLRVNGDGVVLKIPYRPVPEAYTLHVTARRADFGGPRDYGGIILPVIHTRGLVSMYLGGGWKGSTIIGIEPLADAPDFFPSKDPSIITCKVAHDGFTVSNDTGATVEARDVYEKITGWLDVPQGWLRLAVYGSYEFSELKLFPTGSEERPAEDSHTDNAVTHTNALELLNRAIAWYRGEGNADDSAGKHHGKLVGGAAITPIETEHAFDFDGKDGSLIVPDAPELNPRKQFTVMAWVKPRSIKEGGVISKVGNNTGSAGYQFGLRADGSAFVQFNAPGESWPANSVAAKLPLSAIGTWMHIAGSYDGDRLLLYHNGTVVGSKQVGSKSVAASPANFRVSGDDNNAVYFDGLIDDAALFDRALSEGEIEAIYLGTLDGRLEGRFATAEHLVSADGLVFAELTKKLNDFQSWTVAGGQWVAQDGGIRGKGDSGLKFNNKLPAEFTLMFRMRVLAGIRPRIHFDNRQFWFGNEGYDHNLFVHGSGQQGTTGAPRAYKDGAALDIVCRVEGQQVEFFVDGEPVARCQRKNAGPLTLELSAGDGFSAGDVVFDSFRLDFALPSLTDDQRSLVARYSNPNTIDVLALVDPARDAKSGKWTADLEGLHSPADTYCGSLRLPVAVPDEYSLTIVAARTKGWKGNAPILSVGHVASGKQFNSTIDWEGTAGLERLDGRHAHENETTAQCGNLFEDGRTSVVTYIVRRKGVEMLFDGRQILNWQGDYRRFSLQDGWKNPINSPLRLFLGTHCDWHFKAIRLTPLTDAKTESADPQQPSKDLLKTIDMAKHARGGWAFDGSVLALPANVSHAGVRFPGAVPGEYRLRIVAERPRGFQGPPQLHVGLVTQSSQATLVLDADHKSGLEAVAGKMYHDNATTFQGDLFIDGVESTIDCTVGKEGIRVDFDGRTIIDWHGELKQLKPTWTQFGAPRRTFWIGTHCNYRIKKVELLDKE